MHGGEGEKQIVIPPRYGGVRFVKTKRSDGRESVFERRLVPMAKDEPFVKKTDPPLNIIQNETVFSESENSPSLLSGDVESASDEKAEDVEVSACFSGVAVGEKNGDDIKKPPSEYAIASKEKSGLAALLKSVGEDDILIIALILILAAQQGENNRDIVLLLALLLCFR